MVQTAHHIGQSGADGIKLHLLHVLSGTDLAEEYAAGAFETMPLEAYISALESCLRVLPREMVIHRMTGDGAKRSLIAPLWSADKKRVLECNQPPVSVRQSGTGLLHLLTLDVSSIYRFFVITEWKID